MSTHKSNFLHVVSGYSEFFHGVFGLPEFSINEKNDSELTTGNLQPLWTRPRQMENHNQAILTNHEYVPEDSHSATARNIANRPDVYPIRVVSKHEWADKK